MPLRAGIPGLLAVVRALDIDGESFFTAVGADHQLHVELEVDATGGVLSFLQQEKHEKQSSHQSTDYFGKGAHEEIFGDDKTKNGNVRTTCGRGVGADEQSELVSDPSITKCQK